MSQSSSEEARDDEPDEIELRFSAARKPGRLRVLCLHGHGSNNDITQMQVGNLRLEPVHGVACDFFEGRVLAPARDTTLELFSAGPFKTWVDLDAPNESLARSLRDIMAIIKTHGPYDGIFGFSLGALMATCLSSPAVWRGMFGLAAGPPWSFAVLACAGGSSYVAGATVPQLSGPPAPVLPPLPGLRPGAPGLLQVRSLHLVGQRDGGRADSDAVATWFAPEAASRQVLECAHELPALLRRSAALQSALETFLAPGALAAVSSSAEVAAAAAAAAAPSAQPTPTAAPTLEKPVDAGDEEDVECTPKGAPPATSKGAAVDLSVVS